MNPEKAKLICQITRLYLTSSENCNGMIAFKNYVYLNDGTPDYITGIDKSIQGMEIICHIEKDVGNSLGWFSITEFKKHILKEIKKQLNEKQCFSSTKNVLLSKPFLMPSLEHLLNYQKGKLVHNLFPEEIPGFLKFLYVCGQKMSNDSTTLKVILLSFPDSQISEWKEFSFQVNEAIDLLGDRLASNAHIFGYEIFDHFRGAYTIHCLRSYALLKNSNCKFRMLIDVLFT